MNKALLFTTVVMPVHLCALAFSAVTAASEPVAQQATSAAKASSAQKAVDNQPNEEKQPALQELERIQVYGRRWLPQTTHSEGSYTLNREFLDNALKGNGNVTDMLLFLPGVQGAEGAMNVNLQAEIRSQLLSISGAQPWQTAFVLDGVDNNSYLDPGSSNRSPTAINDVQGHPEATFVNQELIGSVTLYDRNIPARYGAFNGGVVDMRLRDPGNSPRFTLNYRRSQSSWGDYHFLDFREYNEDAEADAKDVNWPTAPNFDKESLSFSASRRISEQQAITVSLARTTSTITDISLQQPVQTKRESISTALTYQLDDVLLDRVRINLGYSPYTGRHIIPNVRDSEFDLKGGGSNFSLQLENSLWNGDWRATLAFTESENSRSAPAHFLPWIRAKGKEWGIDSGQPPLSMEGGYGDLDKTQTSWRLNTDYEKSLGFWLQAEHRIDVGLSHSYLQVQRTRSDMVATYSAPWRDANIQCGAHSMDCIEQQFAIPLAELAAQLGGRIDFSNPQHLAAYQENLLARGQFFRYRRLYLPEDIQVELQQSAGYGEYQVIWPRLAVTLGLRADYDDFLENLNVGYRSRAALNLQADGDTTLVVGMNRYYAANLLTYQLREGQRPYVTQYRTISNGAVGGWITSSSAPRYQYRYDNLRTPYSDELTTGINHRVGVNGMLSLHYVQRRGYDQVTRGPEEYLNGITYLYQTNDGENRHDRISLAYNHAWQGHALGLNVSYTENQSSAESYDGGVVGVPEDELVVLRALNGSERLLSYDDLTRRQMDFSRPITANAVWNARWFEHVSTTLMANYVGKFDSVIDANTQIEFSNSNADICQGCQIDALTYPLFIEYQRPARLLFNGRVEYRLHWLTRSRAAVNFEVKNILNARTYTVGPNSAGIEVGREFWLGVNVTW